MSFKDSETAKILINAFQRRRTFADYNDLKNYIMLADAQYGSGFDPDFSELSTDAFILRLTHNKSITKIQSGRWYVHKDEAIRMLRRSRQPKMP